MQLKAKITSKIRTSRRPDQRTQRTQCLATGGRHPTVLRTADGRSDCGWNCGRPVGLRSELRTGGRPTVGTADGRSACGRNCGWEVGLRTELRTGGRTADGRSGGRTAVGTADGRSACGRRMGMQTELRMELRTGPADGTADGGRNCRWEDK